MAARLARFWHLLIASATLWPSTVETSMRTPHLRLLRRTLSLGAFAALLTTALTLHPTAALACGGCFSPPGQQTTQLVLQNAERVLFHQDPKTHRTTVWVEVRFSGLAEDFGWVLPLPKKPKVSVGSSWVFDQLDQRHAPRFSTQLEANDENCRSWQQFCFGDSAQDAAKSASGGGFNAAPNAGSRADSDGASGEAVQVLEKDQAGPYDYEILASKDAKALLDWLNKNGYATPAAALPIIDSHLAKGDLFVAVKLQNNAGVNEIKPIVLEMDDSDACVPLRLTSIAATEDMSVVVTMAGQGRGVPKNHQHVEVNPLKLNWFQGGNNYGQVLSAAIDEAAGRAFATEYAGPGKDTALVSEGQRMNALPISLATSAAELGAALLKSNLILNQDSVAILEKHTGLAKLAGQEPLSYFSQLTSCGYANQRPGSSSWCAKQLQAPSTLPIDGPKLADALDKEFIAPIHAISDALITSQRVTRLVMRISPEEMDRDPIFAFNQDLPDVSNQYVAQFRRVCSTGWYPYDKTRLSIDGIGSWVIDGTVPNDFNASGEIGNNAVDPRFKQAPMALRVELLDETGPATPIPSAQIELVDQAIAGATVGKPALPATLVLAPVEQRWPLPANDGSVRHVDKRDDSKCPIQRTSKPWNDPGTNDAAVMAEAGAGGCTASPRPVAGVGGLAGLLTLLATALIVLRRRSTQVG